MAKIVEKEALQGQYVNLRENRLSDAAFVIDLRCSPKARFLNPTKNDTSLQEKYIANYLKKQDEWYFIIEDKNGKSLGTIRIYNVIGEQFEAGSWLMSDCANVAQSLEGEYLLKNYAYHVLGFNKNCFSVRKENKKVVNFHKVYGARIVKESEIDYFFELTREEFDLNKHKILDIAKAYA